MGEIWLIAGLGNPGPRYDRTRHNAGFWFMEALERSRAVVLRSHGKLFGLADKVRIDGAHCVLLRPDTWMNESGRALRAAVDYYDIGLEQVLVAHDDLDLPPGTVRLKLGGGHGGHNGLRSALAHLGDPGFWRLRIGIGHPGIKDAVTPWVLSRAPAEEETVIRDAISRAVEVLPEFLAGRADAAMKSLHSRDSGLGTRDSQDRKREQE